MKRSLSRLMVWMLLLLGGVGGLRAEEFEYGKRPLDGTFDPTGFLDLAVHREIAASLSLAMSEKNHEVLLVILDDLEGAPPEFVARKFADVWKTEDLGAVLLHVPGRLSSPWIVPFGAKVERFPSEDVSLRVRNVRRRLGGEDDEAERLRLATALTIEMLHEWESKAGDQSSAASRNDEGKKVDPHDRMMRMIKIYAALGFTAILVVVALVTRALIRRPCGKVFPDFHPHQRFGAPYCGGSHVVVRIDSRKKPE